jgi:hypothetical protein
MSNFENQSSREFVLLVRFIIEVEMRQEFFQFQDSGGTQRSHVVHEPSSSPFMDELLKEPGLDGVSHFSFPANLLSLIFLINLSV